MRKIWYHCENANGGTFGSLQPDEKEPYIGEKFILNERWIGTVYEYHYVDVENAIDIGKSEDNFWAYYDHYSRQQSQSAKYNYQFGHNLYI